MKPALLLLAAAVAGAGGCASNDLSISIVQMQSVTPDTMCVAMATAGPTVGLGRGVLDVSLVTTAGYIAVPVVQNNLMSNMNGIEFNAVTVTGANVKLTDAAGKTLTLPSGQSSFFYASAGGRLPPGGSVPIFVEVVPKDAALALAGQIPAGGTLTVVAEVQPVGMRSTDQIVGGAFDYPIDLCSGCLVKNSTCPLATKAVDPCFPQQDEQTICCTDANNATLCGSAAPVGM